MGPKIGKNIQFAYLPKPFIIHLKRLINILILRFSFKLFPIPVHKRYLRHTFLHSILTT